MLLEQTQQQAPYHRQGCLIILWTSAEGALLCCPELLFCTMPLFKHRKGKEPASTRTELRPDLTQPNIAPPPGKGSPVQPEEVVRVRAKAEAEVAQPAQVKVKVMAQPLPMSSEVRAQCRSARPLGGGGAHSRVLVLRVSIQAPEGKGAANSYHALDATVHSQMLVDGGAGRHHLLCLDVKP